MKNSKPRTRQVKPNREQPRKDSKAKRVNLDNERESKFIKDNDKQFSKWNKDSKSKDCNDISWYARNKLLLESAASYNIASSVGEWMTTQPLGSATSNNSVPGVMAINYFPYLSGGSGDAIQRAKADIYSFVVHANSRNQSYDDTDLMFVIIAGSCLFSAYAMGVRAYGTMRMYSQEDQYTPEALVTAMGFSYSDLKANLSTMWFDINELAARLQQIWIPDVLPLTQRWYWMNSHIYRDGNSVKSQYYLFKPTLFYRFDETQEETGTSLATYPWGSSQTWASYMSMMNALINSLINSQDRGIMFGDILKAYGAERLYAVTGINADYMYTPVYNAEVLSQIENLTTWEISSPANVIQTSNGVIQTQMTLKTSSQAASFIVPARQTVLNFHQLQPATPEQNMIATRLKTAGVLVQRVSSGTGPGGVDEFGYAPAYAGTEVVQNLTIYNKAWLTNGTTALNYFTFGIVGSGTQIPVTTLFKWCSFDWAPWLYLNMSGANWPTTLGAIEEGSTVYYPIGDFDNYTFINAEVLRKMHLTAVYSEFGVPSSLG